MQKNSSTTPTLRQKNWDPYFHKICIAVSSKSPCNSRQIGAILVRDNSILATGYNGPPRKIPHCGPVCPRKLLGYQSGTHLELCPAQHAETNTISNSARLGVSTLDSTLYMNTKVLPCKNCWGMLINAGVVEVVVEELNYYDKRSEDLIENSQIHIRRFLL